MQMLFLGDFMESLPILRDGNITIKNREELTIDGAESILSFDDYSLVVMTTLGKLTVEGEGMVIDSLVKETKRIIVKGKISGLYYSDNKKTKGLFR